jgi:hypothetical protein
MDISSKPTSHKFLTCVLWVILLSLSFSTSHAVGANNNNQGDSPNSPPDQKFLAQQCQEIPLHQGWNLISWNVAYSGDIKEFISPIRDKVDIILGFDQGALTYSPLLEQFSTLTEVDYKHGYWFKMNSDTTLSVCGESIHIFDYIPIYEGWNLVSYWFSNPMSVQSALFTINANLQIVIGFDHGIQLFIPSLPEFNTLTEMKPGFGYWIRSSSNDLLDYFFMPSPPDEDRSKVAKTSMESITSREWMSVYGSNLTVDGAALPENSTIEVYTTNGTLVGKSLYQNNVLKFMPVYGFDSDDPQTSSYPKEGDELFVHVNGTKAIQSIIWQGLGAVTKLDKLTSTSVLPEQFSLSQNYPNPFNPETTIDYVSGSSQRITITVYNPLGQKVRLLMNEVKAPGTYRISWDGTDDNGKPVASGVYFYQLVSGKFTNTKKMIVLR